MEEGPGEPPNARFYLLEGVARMSLQRRGKRPENDVTTFVTRQDWSGKERKDLHRKKESFKTSILLTKLGKPLQ
jgi:hypothetical protein